VTDFLSVDDLLEIAAGVLPEVAVRDLGLLASAAARPQTSVFGDDAYPSFGEKAAALMHSLARNHPLVDGNKRLAWAATRAFCLLNGCDVTYESVDAAEQFVLGVAAGAIDVPEIAAWLVARGAGSVDS
jgi:death-on-curing protein